MSSKFWSRIYSESASDAPSVRQVSPAEKSDADGAFEHFYGSAAHAGYEFLSRLRDLHLDVARTAHLHPLKNAQGVTSRKPAVAHEIGAERTGSGTRCGVLVEFPG